MVPVAVERHEGPGWTLHVFGHDTQPQDLLVFVEECRSRGRRADGYHPWWGQAARVQTVAELLSGTDLAGRPFVVESRG